MGQIRLRWLDEELLGKVFGAAVRSIGKLGNYRKYTIKVEGV